MTTDFEQLNHELVTVFNHVTWIEEAALRRSDFADITMKDMHTIDAISMYESRSASQVARLIHLTPSAMTSAIDKLVEKGYVERRRSTKDRRKVYLGLTHRGRVVFRAHQSFHREISRQLVVGIPDDQVAAVTQAIHNLMTYLSGVFEQ